jgi:hypothetical protein
MVFIALRSAASNGAGGVLLHRRRDMRIYVGGFGDRRASKLLLRNSGRGDSRECHRWTGPDESTVNER